MRTHADVPAAVNAGLTMNLGRKHRKLNELLMLVSKLGSTRAKGLSLIVTELQIWDRVQRLSWTAFSPSAARGGRSLRQQQTARRSLRSARRGEQQKL